MKLTLDNSDLSMVLETFCPSLVSLEDGKFSLSVKGKKIVLGETVIELNSQIVYDKINGVVDLQLNKNGATVDLLLK